MYHTIIYYNHTCAQGEIPPEKNFFDPPPPSAAEKRNRKKIGGKAAKFLTFSEAKPPKIGGFRLFFAKMALFPAKLAHFPPKWSNLLPFGVPFLILLSPPPRRL